MTALNCCTPDAKAGDLWHAKDCISGRANERLSPAEKARYRSHPAKGTLRPLHSVDFMGDPGVKKALHFIEYPFGCPDLECRWCSEDPFDEGDWEADA